MSDRRRDRGRPGGEAQELPLEARKRALIDELWPCPEPPRDLAAQVLARLHRGPVRAVTSEFDVVVEKSPQAPTSLSSTTLRRRLPLPVSARLAGAGVLAAAAILILVWVVRPRLGGSGDADGQVEASATETVNIGTRAAAAVERGSALAWSVREKQVRVEQRRGSVLYRVRRGGPFRVFTPAGDVEVTGTSFRVTMGPQVGSAATTLVSVVEGSVKVHSGAGTQALIAGQTARLSPDRAPELLATTPPAPAAPAPVVAAPAERPRVSAPRPLGRRAGPAALLLPHAPGERLQVFADGLREVSLAVPPGRAGAGTVEVARDARFSQPVWRGPAPAGFVTVPAPASGDLYWRVQGADAPAAHARFRPERRPSRGLSSPRNLVAQERESTTVYFQSAAPALTLAWAPVPGASSYRVRLTRASAPQRLVFERLVSDASCAVPPGVLGEGSYLWTVLPVGTAVATESPVRRLELVYDNAVSTLAITKPQLQPRAGVSAGRVVEVQGVAPLGARLFVNGKAASVDDKGRFSLRVARPAGTLIFRLLEKDGAESYWVRPLASRS
jgi:hypothetical protein